MKILIINGPNLNLLGTREPNKYGDRSLADLERQLSEDFPTAEILFFQSNHEGEIIDRIHAAQGENVGGIVFNPAAFTFTSLAICEAIKAIKVRVIEVHLTNYQSHDRQQSIIVGACWGQISGFGFLSYHLAVNALLLGSPIA